MPCPPYHWFNTEMRSFSYLLLACLALLASACAGPRPVLYPNVKLEAVGGETAEADIEDCRNRADAAGAHREPGKAGQVAASTAKGGGIGAASGAVGGAISGSPGLGAAVGAATGATASFLYSLFSPSPPSQVHVAFVNRCLDERGYDVIGWD